MLKKSQLGLLCMLWATASAALADELSTETVEKTGPSIAGAEEEDLNWVDEGHAFATDSAQALTEWMDGFFGEPTYDLERAESQIRLQWRNSWDEDDDYKTKLKLRGKLQLPRISQRLNLVFSGEDGDNIVTDEGERDSAGLQFVPRSRVGFP